MSATKPRWNATSGRVDSRPSRISSQRGSALFLLLILAVVSATILGGVFSYISTTSVAERRSNVRLESVYVAEYAFEQAYQQLNTLIASNTVNLPTVADTTGVTNLGTAPTSTFTAADGYTWKSFITVPVEDGVPADAHRNFNPSQGVYKYMTIVEFTRRVANTTSPVHMQFQREWNYTISPLFQYAIFYQNDLELFPGAAFNVSGRVHSNARIYTGTSASITFSDYVTHVNGVANQYHPLDPRSRTALNGPVTYVKASPIVTTQKNPPGQLGADTSDANHNNDGPRELIEMPNNWQTDPNSTERMYNKAGLKVLVNSTGTAATAESGVSIPANAKVFLTSDGTAIPATDPLAAYLSTLMTSGTMQDYRESATVRTVDLDVGQLNTAYNSGGLPQTIPASNNWPNNATVPAALKNKPIPAALRGKSLWNGVLYVADVTNTPTHRTGVKLHNATSLPDGTRSGSPAKGLTVVTPNAAYVVGDYNTGGNPPVNSGALNAANKVAAYTVQPAAVIADAVTVVSNNWVSGGYNSKAALNQRPATNTTLNAALISGTVASNGSAYSGGVENYIRLLEDWGSRRLTYYGSMINVFESEQSTAPWQTTGVYYQAANRNWYFDVNFLDPNKLPPGTPVLRTIMRGQWAQIE